MIVILLLVKIDPYESPPYPLLPDLQPNLPMTLSGELVNFFEGP